ncbi:hypothetical protein CANINC_003634 [Pichia inconspicua]|uniref:PH domain-containing protein n=1 Tax=Pichia inconspicua TaxID=52247 RepID=A0A4T0WY93_9ASCO|nr:hypothetical protein CANINC_003634 [[Candida] inconspicua]
MRLPRESYTVYRLRYGNAEELFLTSRVVFLGKIPNVWLMDKKSVLLNNIYRLRAITEAKNLLAEKITTENFESLVHKDDEILRVAGTPNDNTEITYTLEEIKKTKHKPKITSFLLNLKHREKVTKSKPSNDSKLSIPAIVLDSSTEQKLKCISDDTLGRTTYFSTPRESIELENTEFCKLFVPDENYNHVVDDDNDSDVVAKTQDFISAVHLKHSKISEGQMKDECLPSRTDLYVKNLSNDIANHSDYSPDDFSNKTLSEKQEILRIEINNAMIALHQQNHIDSQEMQESSSSSSSSSDDTFYTAHEQIDPRITFDDSDIDFNATATENDNFSGIQNLKPSNSSTYLLGSSNQKCQLNEQNPIPATLEDHTVYKEDRCTIESPFYIDDKSAETYRILKSNSLATKFASTMETRIAERKKRLSLILKRFEKGEIIKIEKMLVMSYSRDKVGLDSHSGTKKEEKWREYIVVVRATGDIEYPAMIQLYKTNRIVKRDAFFHLKDRLFEDSTDNKNSRSYVDNADADHFHSSSGGEDVEDNTTITDTNNHTSKSMKSVFTKLKPKKDGKKESSSKQKKSNDKTNDKTEEILKGRTVGKLAVSTIVISKFDTEISFANLLDKSIQINKTKGSRVFSYIFLAHSTTSAMTWISFLQQLLDPRDTGAINNNSLMINIPVLNVSLDIIGEKALLDFIMQEQIHSSEFLSVRYHNQGYRFEKPEIFGFILELLKKRLTRLEDANVLSKDNSTREFLDKLYLNEARLALAFKRYDRLEWILGENKSLVQTLWNCIGSTYDLEIREYKHDTHHILHKVLEPPPIEGFVVKLSDKFGRLTTTLGKHYFKLFYAFTSDNILFFQNFYRAVPAFPTTSDRVSPNTFISASGEVHEIELLEKSAKFSSTVFASSPYPLEGNHIAWLTPETTLSEYHERDEYALYDAERRTGLISGAHSMIDLTKVVDVRKVAKDNVSPLLKTSANLIWGINSNTDSEGENDFQQNCFELVTVDQTVVRLNVCTKKTRDEWIYRLKEISQYWSLKKSQELKKINDLRDKNLALLNTTDDQFEYVVASQVMNLTSKQEFSRAQADSEIYSISSYVLDKPILQCGYVYCRLMRGKQFEKLYAVLSPGFIVLYKVYNRSKTSRVAKNAAYYKKVRTIPLSTCYVFSQVGRSHSAYMSTIEIDSKVDYSGIPRVYNDGWRSSEPPVQRLFTVWVGSKKVVIKDRKEKKSRQSTHHNVKVMDVHSNSTMIQSSSENESGSSDNEQDSVGMKFGKTLKRTISNTTKFGEKVNNEVNKHEKDGPEPEMDEHTEFKSVPADEERISPIEILKTRSKLGVAGEGFLFLVRSRIERDIWVTRLMTEIERFSSIRNNDITIV